MSDSCWAVNRDICCAVTSPASLKCCEYLDILILSSHWSVLMNTAPALPVPDIVPVLLNPPTVEPSVPIPAALIVMLLPTTPPVPPPLLFNIRSVVPIPSILRCWAASISSLISFPILATGLSGEFRVVSSTCGCLARLSNVCVMLENVGLCVRCFCQQSNISWYSASGQSIGAGNR